jgi:hypothetical protein
MKRIRIKINGFIDEIPYVNPKLADIPNTEKPSSNTKID